VSHTIKKAELPYHKDERTMRPIYGWVAGCPENFQSPWVCHGYFCRNL